MNKLEFQQKLEEGAELIEKKNYSGAVDFFEDINLDSVKDPRLLQNIAKAYEKCRRYEDAEDLLVQAHNCAPRSRGTLFHLCTVAIKSGDLSKAIKYYNDFCQIAKYDAERYILQYRIAQAEGRDDDELIKILENFKGEEPDDRWMYELAKLYTTNDRTNDALEVCDEITLWFYNGKYVQLAKELRAYLTGEPIKEEPENDEYTDYYTNDVQEEKAGEPSAEDAASVYTNEVIASPAFGYHGDAEDTGAYSQYGPVDAEDTEEEAAEEAEEFGEETEETAEVSEDEVANWSNLEEDGWVGDDKDENLYAESMYAQEVMPSQKYAEIPEDAEETEETKENEELSFVPDTAVFSEEKDPEAPEFSQHSIFSQESGLEIREMDEEEKLPEGEENLTDAIKEAFPSSVWELNESVPETQGLDDEEAPAAENEDAETNEAESGEAEAALGEGESAEDAAAETTADEEIETPEETQQEEQPSTEEKTAEEEKQELLKAAQEEALKNKAEESVDTDSWAHVTFGSDDDEQVTFTVTGETMRIDDSEVTFDDAIFGEEEKPADHVIGHLETYTSDEIIEKDGQDGIAAAEKSDVEEREAQAESSADTEAMTPQKAEAEKETLAEHSEADKTRPEEKKEEEWKRPSEDLNELEDLEAELEKKHASSEKMGGLPIEPETGENTWHFIVFGDSEAETLERSQEILKEFSETIPNCPKRMLKTSAKRIENANIVESLDHFLGSMVIVQNAASLSDDQLKDFSKVLDKDDNSLLIVFTDTAENFEKLFARVPELSESFTAAYEGHRVTARDLVNAAKEWLYYQEALMTREAEGVCYEYARRLLAERKGFYRSAIREYAGRALHYAEHNGLFGMFSGSVDEDGFLHVTDKFFKKAGERK